MGSDSPKQRQELQKQVTKKFGTGTFPLGVFDLEKLNELPAKEMIRSILATSQSKTEETFSKKLVIRFDYFSEGKCDFSEIQIKDIEKIFEIFTQFTRLIEKEYPKAKLELDSITNGQAYAFLYDGIPQEYKIVETKISGESRIFYAKIYHIIQIIGIWIPHIE